MYDPERFAYSPARHLTSPQATIAQFLAFRQRLGMTKFVLTHALSYGSYCSSLRGFTSELGTSNTKVIGVIDPDTLTPEELHVMQRADICGIRVNLYQYKAMHDVELRKRFLRAHVGAIKGSRPGWSMTCIHTHPEFWIELKPVIEKKMDFKEIIDLLRDGHLYIKISVRAPYRVSTQAPAYMDIKPLMRAFFDADPRHVLWWSDWPHTPHMKVRLPEEALKETPYHEVDDLAWLRSLRSLVSNEKWYALMVENPTALYG
ncbi:hypothetical protein BDV12DRAFT_205797 [Aspergillus spectabilis]